MKLTRVFLYEFQHIYTGETLAILEHVLFLLMFFLKILEIQGRLAL